jgi:hypothetical protein
MSRELYGSFEQLIEHCANGWYERVEFGKLVQYEHGSTIEQRASSVWQQPLVTQLRLARFAKRVTVKDGGSSPGKSHKKPPPPGNLEETDDIIHAIAAVACKGRAFADSNSGPTPHAQDAIFHLMVLKQDSHKLSAWQLAEITHQLARVVRRARIHLGYESDDMQFADTVCGDCGGALAAERRGATEVRCVGTPLKPSCGKVYPWQSWAELLAAGPVLVDTKTAARCLGVEPATIYRWKRTGKVTRYGGRKQGEARWDLDELKSHQETLDKRRRKV